MTRKCKVRNWPLARFAASVRAQAKRRGVKLTPAAIKQAYDDGLTVQFAVTSLAGAATAK
jgi:hypothetical protein